MEVFRERSLRKDLSSSKKEKTSGKANSQQNTEIHIQWYEENDMAFVENNHKSSKKGRRT